MKRLLLAASVALGLASPAAAQIVGKTTTQTKLAMTGSFLLAIPNAAPRAGCLIQNRAATNPIFIFFGGAAAPSDTTTSYSLVAGASLTCGVGGQAVATDNVWISGTAADVVIIGVQ